MRGITSSAAIFAAFLGVLAAVPKATADDHDKKTTITFEEAVEVPGGVVLQPGKYVFILQNSQNDRNIVLIKNDRENKTYAQVFATNAFHVKAEGKTQVLFWESPAGQPAILRAWFYPGDNYGQSFMYKKIELQKSSGLRRVARKFPLKKILTAPAARIISWQCAEVLSTASLQAKRMLRAVRIPHDPVASNTADDPPRGALSRRPVPLRRWSAA